MAFNVCTTCISNFPPSTAQKWEFFKKIFDTPTIHNHELSNVKHVFDPLCVFFTLLGCFFLGGGGGSPRGLGHNLLMQFSSLCSSKMEISKTDFFCILTSHNDQISYVKPVLDPLNVFFTLLGCLDGDKGLEHNLLMQFSTLSSSKMETPSLFELYC